MEFLQKIDPSHNIYLNPMGILSTAVSVKSVLEPYEYSSIEADTQLSTLPHSRESIITSTNKAFEPANLHRISQNLSSFQTSQTTTTEIFPIESTSTAIKNDRDDEHNEFQLSYQEFYVDDEKEQTSGGNGYVQENSTTQLDYSTEHTPVANEYILMNVLERTAIPPHITDLEHPGKTYLPDELNKGDDNYLVMLQIPAVEKKSLNAARDCTTVKNKPVNIASSSNTGNCSYSTPACTSTAMSVSDEKGTTSTSNGNNLAEKTSPNPNASYPECARTTENVISSSQPKDTSASSFTTQKEKDENFTSLHPVSCSDADSYTAITIPDHSIKTLANQAKTSGMDNPENKLRYTDENFGRDLPLYSTELSNT